MAKRFEPFNDYVLVEPLPPTGPAETHGLVGIDKGKEKPTEGIVVAWGNDLESLWADERDLEEGSFDGLYIGDHVIHQTYAGTEITLNGKPMRVMRFAEIFGRLIDEQPVSDDNAFAAEHPKEEFYL